MSDVSSLRKATTLPAASGRSLSTVRYIDGELTLSNGTNWTYPQRVETTFSGGVTDAVFYVANRAMEVVAIRQVHSTAGSDSGAVTLKITKDSGAVTPGGDSAGAATTTTAGVAGVNEVQSIAAHGVGVDGGTYTLTFTVNGGAPFTTAAIAYNANAATIQTAIDVAATALPVSGWTNGDIVVTGGPLSTTAATLTFSGASVDKYNQAQTTIDGTNLTNGVAGAASTTTAGVLNVNEVQSIAPFINTVTGGTYTLSFTINGGDTVTTAAIAYNANAATVQTAVDLVSGVTAGHVAITGGPLTTTALTITFSGASVDETNQGQTTIDGSSLVSGALSTMTGTFNLKGTANTVQTATLTATTANKKLAAGDKLSANFAGTTTDLAGVVATVTLRPI